MARLSKKLTKMICRTYITFLIFELVLVCLCWNKFKAKEIISNIHRKYQMLHFVKSLFSCFIFTISEWLICTPDTFLHLHVFFLLYIDKNAINETLNSIKVVYCESRVLCKSDRLYDNRKEFSMSYKVTYLESFWRFWLFFWII